MTNHTNLFFWEHLKLAFPRFEDADIVSEWGGDAEYLRNLDTAVAYPQAKGWDTGEGYSNQQDTRFFHFSVRTIGDDRLVGFAAIHGIEWNNRTGNLAVAIGEPGDRNKGYGQEALKLILRYAFHELNLDRVGLEVIEYNKSGIRAYEKVGFQHEGRKRAFVYRDGNRYDLLVMGILRSEWEEIYLV